MSTALQLCATFAPCKTFHGDSRRVRSNPIDFGIKLAASRRNGSFRFRVYQVSESDRFSLFARSERWKKKKKQRVVVAQSFGFNGGGKDDGSTGRVLGNLALAVGLTYLSMTGQLGWLLDAIVSVWLLAFILPIVGVGAFLWWAGRDIVQSSCPNCGNEFQIFKSSMKEELQLCPFCTQPFSVVDNKFVRDTVNFSNQSTTFADSFKDFPRSKKGKETSAMVVDIEAEVKDVD